MLYYPQKHFLKVDRNVVFGLCDWPQATQVTERTQGFSPETKIEEQNFFLLPSADEQES